MLFCNFATVFNLLIKSIRIIDFFIVFDYYKYAMYNLHSHTNYSHDGKCTVFELVEGAIGVFDGIAITEHVDFIKPDNHEIVNRMLNCYRDVIKARELYGDKIKIFMGGEFGEEDGNLELGNELRNSIPFDMISCSRHIIEQLGPARDYGYDYDFKNATQKDLDYFINLYIDAFTNTVLTTDVDVLCHLTLPLRYIIRNGKSYDITKIDNKIENLLKIAISRGIAIEINTSEYKNLNMFMPDEYYLKMYKSLGGKLLTIGSDAHHPSTLTCGISQAIALIKKLDFEGYYYFENRKPHLVKI